MNTTPMPSSTLSLVPGGSLVDTADGYSHWADGNNGGESERIIGSWLEQGGRRDDIVIATKVATHPEFKGLAPENISACLLYTSDAADE